MVYVGIDYSINSTAMYCYEDDKYYQFDNFQRDVLSDKKLEMLKSYKLNIHQHEKLPTDLLYEDFERLKIKESIKVAENLIYHLENFLENRYDYKYNEVKIGIEGLSYSGTGQRAIDLAGFQYVLRSSLYKAGFKNITIVSPKTLKKFAVKGNATKKDMMIAFIEKAQQIELLQCVIDNDYQKLKNPPKPIDDLIDAYFIVEYLRNI